MKTYDPQVGANFDTRDKILTTLVENLQMISWYRIQNTKEKKNTKKYQALYFQTRRFLNLHFETHFWPHDIFMQQTGTIWTTLKGDHPRIILVKFGYCAVLYSYKRLPL
jgi:hypothetical protein